MFDVVMTALASKAAVKPDVMATGNNGPLPLDP
jgi:hypothetical protein